MALLGCRGNGGDNRLLKKQLSRDVQLIHPDDLAKDLHSLSASFLLLDCRPILAYNSCHIIGAVNINFTGMIKRRFIAGRMSLADLVTTEEGKEEFKNRADKPAVVYDECSADLKNLAASNALRLVLLALEEMGKISYVLQGGLSEFNVLHPSLCEINLPTIRQTLTPAGLRATTPGLRDQPLDWQTAPPVHVLSYLVLGGKKDAMSKEVFDDFKIKFVLNVTPTCANYFEGKDITYMRIAVTDTGTQKLSDKFQEAFDFIEEARRANSIILIHCMAGVSRSVTLTIAYLMNYFGLSMQAAYQLVKDKRPAISPNLNFMGQLVAFEQELKGRKDRVVKDLSDFTPSEDQEKLTEEFQNAVPLVFGSADDKTPSPKVKLSPGSGSGGGSVGKFMLKLPLANRKTKKLASSGAAVTNPSTAAMNLRNSPTLRDEPEVLSGKGGNKASPRENKLSPWDGEKDGVPITTQPQAGRPSSIEAERTTSAGAN